MVRLMPRKKGWKYNKRDADLIAAFLHHHYEMVTNTRDAFKCISPENRDEWYEGQTLFLSHKIATIKTLYRELANCQYHTKPAPIPEGG